MDWCNEWRDRVDWKEQHMESFLDPRIKISLAQSGHSEISWMKMEKFAEIKQDWFVKANPKKKVLTMLKLFPLLLDYKELEPC